MAEINVTPMVDVMLVRWCLHHVGAAVSHAIKLTCPAPRRRRGRKTANGHHHVDPAGNCSGNDAR